MGGVNYIEAQNNYAHPDCLVCTCAKYEQLHLFMCGSNMYWEYGLVYSPGILCILFWCYRMRCFASVGHHQVRLQVLENDRQNQQYKGRLVVGGEILHLVDCD